jgi:glycine/D-amino acid oxidase-like deaminating enzyme
MTADPSVRVAVVEAEIAGFGAAGRNGGFVSAGIAGSAARYARVSGWDSVLRAEPETQHGIDEIGRVVSTEDIDCGYNKAGALTVATTEPQAQRVRARVEAKHRFGLGPDDIRLLTAEECADLVRGAEGVLAGSYSPHCARVDPARLARGLASACERLGVKIFEQSPAQHLGPKVVQCRNGRVTADVVVRATESYTIHERSQRRSFLPLYSLMIATEPLPQETWDELGWRDGLGIGDIRHLYYYAQRTIDGRIALGGRGAPYRLTDPLSPQNEQDAEVFQRLCETLREAFPAASQARITHHWGGSLAVPRDWCMRTTFDRNTGARIRGCVRRSRRHRRQHLRPHHARPDPERQHRPDLAPMGGTPHPQLGTRAHPIHRLQAHHQDPRRLRCLRGAHWEAGEACTAGGTVPATELTDRLPET